MFIKIKARAGMTYVYQMPLSFKTSVSYKKDFLILRRTTLSVVKQLPSDITQFFAKYCPMYGANIHACVYNLSKRV